MIWKRRGLTALCWAKLSFTTLVLLLNVASLSGDICTYAYQGRVWMYSATCFCAPFCQLCGSVLIHDPGRECMSSSPLFEDKRSHVCVSSCISAFVLYSLWLPPNLACTCVRASLPAVRVFMQICYPVIFPPCPCWPLLVLWSCVAAHYLCAGSSEEENSFVAVCLHISVFF